MKSSLPEDLPLLNALRIWRHSLTVNSPSKVIFIDFRKLWQINIFNKIGQQFFGTGKLRGEQISVKDFNLFQYITIIDGKFLFWDLQFNYSFWVKFLASKLKNYIYFLAMFRPSQFRSEYCSSAFLIIAVLQLLFLIFRAPIFLMLNTSGSQYGLQLWFPTPANCFSRFAMYNLVALALFFCEWNNTSRFHLN